MNLSLVVGLSVDYVVHLAEGYHLSLAKDRHGRVRDMLAEFGTSVLCGFTTTFGSAVFMMFAELQFFLQFGTCLICTIGFSFVYSIVFFATVMAIVGPQGETGSVRPLVAYVRRKLRGRSGTDVDCAFCDGRGFLVDPPAGDEPDDRKPKEEAEEREEEEEAKYGGGRRCIGPSSSSQMLLIPAEEKVALEKRFSGELTTELPASATVAAAVDAADCIVVM